MCKKNEKHFASHYISGETTCQEWLVPYVNKIPGGDFGRVLFGLSIGCELFVSKQLSGYVYGRQFLQR